MLQINNIEVMYNNVVLVLKGVSLDAKEGKITTCWAPMALAKPRP